MTADSGTDQDCSHAVGLSMTVPVGQITAARHSLVDWARSRRVPRAIVDAIALAAYEAMANAAEHAYPNGDGEVTLRATRGPGGTVIATVVDHGRWRQPPADPGTRGHGIPLIHQLADDADIHFGELGTRVRMRWYLPASEPATGRSD